MSKITTTNPPVSPFSRDYKSKMGDALVAEFRDTARRKAAAAETVQRKLDEDKLGHMNPVGYRRRKAGLTNLSKKSPQ